ncbi:MAG: hypothetical protein R3C05_03355 [Pirellulaceae bacterium]
MPVRRLNTVLPFAALLLLSLAGPVLAFDFGESRHQRESAIQSIPLARLTPSARQRVEQIISRPTMFRRLPTQGMDCDRDMFLFLVRHPEVLVGIWDVMDITQVQMQRTGPYNLVASDGQGTTCQIELVYGDAETHLYVARGKYEGPMVAKPITGSGVFVLHSSYAQGGDRTTIGGQMDVFLELDSLGADLVVRTLGPLIGKSADHNFIETAKFITQISQASEVNPSGVRKLGLQLPQVSEPVREGFIDTAIAVGLRNGNTIDPDEPLADNDSPWRSDSEVAPSASAQVARIAPSEAISGSTDSDDAFIDPVGGSSPVQPRKPTMNLRR